VRSHAPVRASRAYAPGLSEISETEATRAQSLVGAAELERVGAISAAIVNAGYPFSAPLGLLSPR